MALLDLSRLDLSIRKPTELHQTTHPNCFGPAPFRHFRICSAREDRDYNGASQTLTNSLYCHFGTSSRSNAAGTFRGGVTLHRNLFLEQSLGDFESLANNVRLLKQAMNNKKTQMLGIWRRCNSTPMHVFQTSGYRHLTLRSPEISRGHVPTYLWRNSYMNNMCVSSLVV